MIEVSNIFHYDLVCIEWMDSYGVGSSWEETSNIKTYPHHCFSVGWVVKENEDAITLIPHISPADDRINADEQGCGDMTIPKSAIVSRILIGDNPANIV